jgi:phosphoenolpyruvate carboxykinase (GTP)
MWPGYGENMRVLKWILDRSHGRAYAKETLVGWMPQAKDIDLEGLSISRERSEELQAVNPDEVKAELLGQEELSLKVAGDLPKEMIFQRALLISRL